MAGVDLLSLFVAPLEAQGLVYMVSGSVAAIQYGEPRATLDLDAAIVLNDEDLISLGEAFPAREYYLPPVEVLAIEIRRSNRGHFNVIHGASGLKADFYPSRSHPYFGWALANRRRIEIDGMNVQFAPPEYAILWKLEFLREGGGEKHGRDIRGILSVQGAGLDIELLGRAVRELGLKQEWKKVTGMV